MPRFTNDAARSVFPIVPQCLILISLSLFLIMPPLAATPSASAPESSRNLLWQDTFNQAPGTAPDPAKWTHELGDHGWGNAERQCYTASLENAFITADAEATDGRALVIRAQRDATTGRITSARLKTQGKFAAQFGRIEARLKLPKGRGIWAAFWTLGENIGTSDWPECGEIDIMEHLGHQPGRVYGTIHGPGHSGGNNLTTAHCDAPEGGDFSAGYHVFAVEWRPGRIEWLVDGECYHSATPDSLPAGARWVFDETPQFLLLNLAVGGHWPGYPDETTRFPQEYRIDYVRVWGE